jgi:hypothetical protein
VTSQELIKSLLKRIGKFKWLVIIGGICMGALLFMVAKRSPTVYSVRSSVFPLTATSENNSASSKLTELIGGGGGTKSLSDEATINIEEVAKSRRTREAVAAVRLPQFGNKMIGQLLIEEYNKNRSFFAPEIKIPTFDSAIASQGASMIVNNYSAKVNKNSLLEISFTSTNKDLISPVSYVLIDRISSFYKELKIKKAKFDYDFTEKKVDSLQRIINKFDRQQIEVSQHSLFIPPNRIEFKIPQENMQNDKLRVIAQRNNTGANREEALWRLQKVTPIIEILDRPEAPFTENKPSKILYGAGGFFLGCILLSLLLVSNILYKYFHSSVNKAIYKEEVVVERVTEIV